MRSFVIAVMLASGLAHALRADEPTTDRPRLAVLLVFDQMRGDYLTRWQHLFGDGGFRRLMTEGAWFSECHYPYAMTATGPGHASLATGCSPQTHGIVGNNWYDRQLGASVYCASHPRYDRLPPIDKKDVSSKKDETESTGTAGFGAPVRLLAPTIADALRDIVPKSRIVGLSMKDRSATLPAGRKPDACYWFDKGDFVTSTYYSDRLHPWAAKFNQERSVDRWFGKKWTKLRSDIDYEKHAGVDDAPGEGAGQKQGRTFPHPFGAAEKIGKEYYDALACSPMGNEIVLELAKRAIRAEQLGQDDIPDLLTLSFSSNDLVGHAWGPDSQEVLDITLRSDLILRDLLDYLDEHVGKDRYVVVLSADHGVCPLPERTRANGTGADRELPLALRTSVETHLRTKFGRPDEAKSNWIEAINEGGIYLNQRLAAARRVELGDVAAAAVAFLNEHPVIQTAFYRNDLVGRRPQDDPVRQRVLKTMHPERSGDVYIVVKPFHLLTTYPTGTSHGTPHSYDTHVPLVILGAGVKPGKRVEAVTPQACAAILAKALGVTPPAKAEANVPHGLFSR